MEETDQEISARDLHFAIIVSRYNPFITEKLLNGAIEALHTHGANAEQIAVFPVPGSFEIPQMARRVAAMKKHDAIICVGALIRGETLHFELISQECARGLQNVAADFGIPVTFGVITANTMDQAMQRAGERSENKGWEAGLAAIEMATAYKRL
jgi:6,7-dimethyl-8-ribityllumazine synthase